MVENLEARNLWQPLQHVDLAELGHNQRAIAGAQKRRNRIGAEQATAHVDLSSNSRSRRGEEVNYAVRSQ